MNGLIGLTLLWGLHAAPVNTQDEEWITLGERTFFGQTDPDARQVPERVVPIRFPRESPVPVSTTAPYVEWNGWRVLLNEWGNPERLVRGEGGWAEFRALYEEAQQRIAEGRARTWKVKAVLFLRLNVTFTDVDGVVDRQRTVMTAPETQFALETFARFEAVVEAFTQGAVDIQITASVEEEPVRGAYKAGEVWALDPRVAGEEYLRGRFNPGDFDSILYMYLPGPVDSFSFGGTAGRTNNATQAFVIISSGREGGVRIGHTEAMVHEWFHQVEDTYGRWGYGGYTNAALPHLHSAEQNGYTTDQAGYTGWFVWLRDLMLWSVRPGMWSKMSNRQDPDFQAVIKQTKPFSGERHVWSSVKDDPWAKLPFLSPEDISDLVGVGVTVQAAQSQVLFLPDGEPGTTVLAAVDPEEASLNNQLNFSRECMARLRTQDKDVCFVRWDMADFVLDSLDAQVLGYMNVEDKFMVVFEARLPETTAELNALRLGSGGAEFSIATPGDVVLGAGMSASPVGAPRMAVTDLSGRPITDWTAVTRSVGTHVLRAQAVGDDGSRSERPLVVRVRPPVEARVEMVGGPRVTGGWAEVRLTLRSWTASGSVGVRPAAPAGWFVSAPTEVSLRPNERKTVTVNLTAPDGAQSGTYEVAFDLATSEGPAGTVRLAFRLDSAETLVHDSYDSGVGFAAEQRSDQGGWTVESAPGGVSGNSLAITDSGGSHWGRVTLFGKRLPSGQPDPSFGGYDVAAYPFLDFHFKTEATRNCGVSVTLNDGTRAVVMLTGPYLEQWGEATELPRAKFVPNGTWQRVVINLHEALKAALGEGQYIVRDLAIGDTRQFSSNQHHDLDKIQYFVDEFRITRTMPSGVPTIEDNDDELKPVASFVSSEPRDRARAVAGAGEENAAAVAALLSDPAPLVRLNAALYFTRVQYPPAADALRGQLLTEPDQDVGVAMVRALYNQVGDEARDTFKALVRQSRFYEDAAAEAARMLARSRVDEVISDITILYAKRSWLVRREAVRALAELGTENAQRAMMVFLQEVDPMVRLEVARNADVNIDPIDRRMEWGSVNDLSAVVQAYCYAALTRSDDPVMRSRGYAGLRSEMAEVRRIIAEMMGNDSRVEHVQHLEALLSDANPFVRAAALKSLFKMPGQRSFEQLTVLMSEEYDVVLEPLLTFARDGRIALPRAMLERLSMHRNESIRRMAKELVNR
ncbi:MAG: NEW3 domain-containing protein [Armatimonadota bacterium]